MEGERGVYKRTEIPQINTFLSRNMMDAEKKPLLHKRAEQYDHSEIYP